MREGSAGVRRVLVVEDQASARELLVDLLETLGYAAMSVENGQQALSLLEGGLLPSLVLTDLEMPVMDGWALVARLRSEPAWCELPVVAVTGTDPRGLTGVDRILRKPVTLDDLLSVLRRFIG